MVNQWIYRGLTPEKESLKNELSQKLGISDVAAKLLIDRDITTEEEALAFFNPDLSSLHDPYLIKDMDLAVDRLTKALTKREKILIYGDYDVDGTTAVALVYKFLQPYHSDLDTYIPDRNKEGYGISFQGIDYAKEHGYTLVIALDCGVKSVEKVEYAKQRGIDFIICDHHTTDDVLPDAVAVLDSKRADDTYPYKDLSGCGVGFKLMHAFALRNGLDIQPLWDLLDLVAVSIASDIVPMTGENRVLAHYGIKCLNHNPSIGLQAIKNICNLTGKEVTINEIVFKIGPRINAAGRMKSGKEVVELLISRDIKEADEMSKGIENHNTDRRKTDKEITDVAKSMITPNMARDNKSIVVYDPDWNKGVVGIVASRLTEEFYKPTIVLTRANLDEVVDDDDIMISGSARSVQGFDIYAAIDSCRDLLENFGGHIYAAGLSMKFKNLDEFVRRFEQFVSENITKDQLSPQIEIDAELRVHDINNTIIDEIERFQPFGPCNVKPVFVTKRVCDNGSSAVGKGFVKEHLKLNVIDLDTRRVADGIAFNMGKQCEEIKRQKVFDVCYTLEYNTYMGRKKPQLMVRDIKL